MPREDGATRVATGVPASCYRPMNHRVALPCPTLRVVPPIAQPTGWARSMANPPLTSRELVDRLDARHEELIARLDELNAQIESALAEFGRTRKADAEDDELREAA